MDTATYISPSVTSCSTVLLHPVSEWSATGSASTLLCTLGQGSNTYGGAKSSTIRNVSELGKCINFVASSVRKSARIEQVASENFQRGSH